MQTFIFISWCLLFDVLFAAAEESICTETKTSKTLLLIWRVGGKPFKATSSCNCCRDFYSRTDDNNNVYSLFSLIIIIFFTFLRKWTKDNQLFIFIFELYHNLFSFFIELLSFGQTFIENKLFNTVVSKDMVKLT